MTSWPFEVSMKAVGEYASLNTLPEMLIVLEGYLIENGLTMRELDATFILKCLRIALPSIYGTNSNLTPLWCEFLANKLNEYAPKVLTRSHMSFRYSTDGWYKTIQVSYEDMSLFKLHDNELSDIALI